MSGNGNQVPLAPSQRGNGPYPRASTPHRPVECYYPTGAAGAAFMPSTAGGAQSSAQTTLRGVQSTPQPSAPPAPPQDMSKSNMGGHTYVPQNQSQQPRPQYPSFQYPRITQHGTRPNTHPRQQQQPFIPNAAGTATAPVVYHPLVFSPQMGMQPYQQPRTNTPYYPYMGHYIGYNGPQSHTPQYTYYAHTTNSPQLTTPSLQSNTPTGRNNSTTLMGPQGTPVTATAPISTLSHPQAPTHMQQTMSGIRTTVQKRSHRVPIIDPATQQEIPVANSNDNYVGGESSDRQTPQPETINSIVEEFNRKVNEAANQPSDSATKSNYISKNVELPIPSVPSSINNNLVKSEILTLNENKPLGPDIVVEVKETPIVSAISDSPVIVPKLPISIKQLQKHSDQNVQSLVLDANNKNLPHNKIKQNKSKPVVPQVEDVDTTSENASSGVLQNAALISATSAAPHAPPVSFVSTYGIVTTTAMPVPVFTEASSSSLSQTVANSVTHVYSPQPQRIREPRERMRSEEKEKSKEKEIVQETPPISIKVNGPTPALAISSIDSLQEAISPPTSQSNLLIGADSIKPQLFPSLETELPLSEVNKEFKSEHCVPDSPTPTATELLSASIEKLAKDISKSLIESVATPIENKDAFSAIEAQARLEQSLTSVLRINEPDSKMKDVNVNDMAADIDTANGNITEITKTESVKEDINKNNEKSIKNTKNNNKKTANKMANDDDNLKESESQENGKEEIETEQEKYHSIKEEAPNKAVSEKTDSPHIPVFVPKYKYTEDQWSPLNKTGKKCYDIDLMKQIKDDPLSKNKPNVPLLEACNVIRTSPMQEPMNFSSITRPVNDSLFPPFAKTPGMGPRNNTQRDPKKDGRNMIPSGKSSVKMLTPGGPNTGKPIRTISLREDVKLNEVDSAWKPTRFRKDELSEEEFKTQELYKKFRGILNKLTPQKFDTLLDRVKTLEINNQTRLKGVIDLVFEKAIDEPNFSEAYAAMCNKLSMLKVPADKPSSPDQCVNFRALIISKCQNQFVTDKVDEQVLKLEKEIAECVDPVKKKELQLMLVEENRKIRMRSVGNVRFIGELYKLKMLTSKIMGYCMKYLIDKVEEEKLECLCKLLTTIGEQVENEVKDQLDSIFKKMQDIVDRKSNKISSRVRFMIQDVIELRKRRWVVKSVVDSQPKMMDQIQKEAEQHQRQIELMNANPMGGSYRRDDGGRGKRGGEGRRQNTSSFMDNSWKTPRTKFNVDTSKLKTVIPESLTNIKLAPTNSAWNHGSGTKNITQTGSSSMISSTKNMYSLLENVQADPISLKSNRDMKPPYQSKGASIERSTFNSRGDFNSGSSSRSGSINVARSNSSTHSANTPLPPTSTDSPAVPTVSVPQEPLTETLQKSVKSMIELSLISPDDDEVASEVKHLFQPQYHSAVVSEILNIAIEKASEEVMRIAKSLLHLVSTNTITPENVIEGLKQILEFAPDLFIDIPLLYEHLGQVIALQIEKKHITFLQVFKLSEIIISSNHGQQFLKSILKFLNESMGPTFIRNKWHESGLQLSAWMKEDQVVKWVEDNKFEFLQGDAQICEEPKNIFTPSETQCILLQLMNADETCECIKGWVQDKFGNTSNEDWFMRALIQAVCEHALFGPEGRGVPHFNQDRMSKYAVLINEFGETRQTREASCLFGIQQLIRRLEHPQGLTLEIFQFLHEQYIISVEGFIAWEDSTKEPEGKGVMMKALTSFFTNIKEADNEDSCSEE